MTKEITRIPELTRIHGLFDFALAHFRSCLVSGEGVGLSKQTIEQYQIGYAQNMWDHFKKAARKRPEAFTYKEMEKAGLLHVSPTSNKSYDLFRGRIMVPFLHPNSGQCIGFAGRLVVKSETQPKDLFSYTVALFKLREKITIFKKENYLFGVFQAKREILRQNVAYVATEYFDVLRLAQAGIANCVSSSGIPFTLKQAKELKALTDNVVLVYYNNRPGFQAALKKVDVFLAAGMSLKIVVLSESLKEIQDLSSLREVLLNQRQDYILFKAHEVLEGKNSDPMKMEKGLRSVVRTIGFIPQALTRELYLKQCAGIAGVPVNLLKDLLVGVYKKREEKMEIKKRNNNVSRQAVVPPTQTSSYFNNLDAVKTNELELVRLLLRHNQRLVNGELMADKVIKELSGNGITISDPVLWELCRIAFDVRSKDIVPSLNDFNGADELIAIAAQEIISPSFTIRELQPVREFKESMPGKVVNSLKHYLLNVKLEELREKMALPDINDTDREKFIRFEDSYQRTINQHKNNGKQP